MTCLRSQSSHHLHRRTSPPSTYHRCAPLYMTPNQPASIIPLSYQHLARQAPQRPALYGAGQRKYNHLHKFQTGTTTTFNGYTNITGQRHQHAPPVPPPRRNPPMPMQRQHNNYYHRQQYNRPNYHYQPRRFNNDFHQNIQPLLNFNQYDRPSRHNTRSYHHAQQYHPQQQHQSRSISRSRFHVLSQLPSRSRSRSYHQAPPPPIKPRRQHYNQQQQRPTTHSWHPHHHHQPRRAPSPSPTPSQHYNGHFHRPNEQSTGIQRTDLVRFNVFSAENIRHEEI